VTARLHRERVIGAEKSPSRWFAMTHGIYGSGGNWRSIARKIIERRPEWGAILVDLRGHGRSEQGAPPHTIAACADDLRACLDEEVGEGGVEVVAGHSFGGKCVLALRKTMQTQQTWVLDSTPSARPGMWERPDNDVRYVWDAMRELPKSWPKRDDFIAALIARGHSKTLAQWLAMSLHPNAEHRVTLALDLDAVKAMLLDYYAIDLWSAVEDDRLPGDVHVVVAERSDTVSGADRARLAAEPPERRVYTHIIEGAGHWLHLDAPAAVIELIATSLPR
jgi:pimeloyl-ACP methyl ester carboxylesterase